MYSVIQTLKMIEPTVRRGIIEYVEHCGYNKNRLLVHSEFKT
jgi:hypothetical protein